MYGGKHRAKFNVDVEVCDYKNHVKPAWVSGKAPVKRWRKNIEVRAYDNQIHYRVLINHYNL